MSMEHEELEQIPWSALVADADDGPDRRWIWIAAIGLLGVVVYLLVRLLTQGGQPLAEPSTTISEPPVAGCDVDPDGCESPDTTTVGAVVISEEDLRAENPTVSLVMDARAMAAAARAEWFVSDWHTVDGSVATDDSTRSAFVAGIEPTSAVDAGPVTYVEWARASSIEESGEGFRVVVLYRQISFEDEGGWVRNDVRADAVDIVFVNGAPFVAAEPTALADGWGGGG